MRSQEEIQRAHDLIAQLLDGELPLVFGDQDVVDLLEASIPVLCWVLGHEYQEFGGLLEQIHGQLGELGMVQCRLPVGEG